VDQYQYPPPFLLSPYPAYSVGLDFFVLPLPIGPANSAFDSIFMIAAIVFAVLGAIAVAVRPASTDGVLSGNEAFEHPDP
jgi:hypothetical protein